MNSRAYFGMKIFSQKEYANYQAVKNKSWGSSSILNLLFCPLDG